MLYAQGGGVLVEVELVLAVWSDGKVLVDKVAGTSSRYLTVR